MRRFVVLSALSALSLAICAGSCAPGGPLSADPASSPYASSPLSPASLAGTAAPSSGEASESAAAEPSVTLDTAQGPVTLLFQRKNGRPTLTGTFAEGKQVRLELNPDYRLYEAVRLRPLDLDADGRPELLVEAFFKNSGGTMGLHVVKVGDGSLTEWPLPTFDGGGFPVLGIRMDNAFLDGFRLEVACPDTGFAGTLALDKAAFGDLYAPDGTLERTYAPESAGVSSWVPVDLEDGTTGLRLSQTVYGCAKVDALAELQTTLRLSGEGFAIVGQTLE